MLRYTPELIITVINPINSKTQLATIVKYTFEKILLDTLILKSNITNKYTKKHEKVYIAKPRVIYTISNIIPNETAIIPLILLSSIKHAVTKKTKHILGFISKILKLLKTKI